MAKRRPPETIPPEPDTTAPVADTKPVVSDTKPPVSDTGDGREFWVCCERCAHTWIAAYLPMRMEIFAKLLMGAHCPKCGQNSMHITWWYTK